MTKIPATNRPTFVGLKEFRRDVSKYARQAKDGVSKVIVTSHNKPLFMVTPLEDEIYTAAVLQAVATARSEVAAGNTVTLAAVKAEYGI
jgi:prevent-host-death family protein